MALAVKECVGRDLAPGRGSRMERKPIVIQCEGLIPILGGVVQKSANDLDGLLVEAEKRVERTTRQVCPGHDGQTGNALSPAQFRHPDMADKLLHVGGAVYSAGQSQ